MTALLDLTLKFLSHCNCIQSKQDLPHLSAKQSSTWTTTRQPYRMCKDEEERNQPVWNLNTGRPDQHPQPNVSSATFNDTNERYLITIQCFSYSFVSLCESFQLQDAATTLGVWHSRDSGCNKTYHILPNEGQLFPASQEGFITKKWHFWRWKTRTT